MGMPPQDDQPRRTNQERTQMATDEMVVTLYTFYLPPKVHRLLAGYGTL
jgi:hypothetical protein